MSTLLRSVNTVLLKTMSTGICSMPGKKKSSSKNATEGASQTPTLSQSTLSFGTNATPVVKRKASDSVPAPASKCVLFF